MAGTTGMPARDNGVRVCDWTNAFCDGSFSSGSWSKEVCRMNLVNRLIFGLLTAWKSKAW